MDKNDLVGYLILQKEITQMTRILAKLDGDVYSIKSPAMTGMPHAQSSTVGGSAQEKLADRTMAVREAYERKITQLRIEQLRIEKAIDSLKPRERWVLRLRYIEGQSWRKIAAETHFDERWVYRIHGMALEELRKIP